MKKLLAFLLCAVGQGAFAADILYEWDEVVLSGEREYHLRYSIDNVEQPVIDIAGTETSYRLENVGVGSYSAQIAVSEDGLQSEWSPIVTVNVTEKPPEAPSRMTFTVTFECEGDCPIEVK